MTTNCVVPPKDSYKDRLYTTGPVEEILRAYFAKVIIIALKEVFNISCDIGSLAEPYHIKNLSLKY
jgi:hypothetical protein